MFANFAAWMSFAVALIAGRVHAAESLAQYVDDRVALYAEVNHLDADWTALEASELGRRWKTTPLALGLQAAPMMQRWEQLDQKLAQKSGQTLTQHLRRLFSQTVALALFLPESGEPQALLLARGESATTMQETIATWNRLESQVQVSTKTAGQQSYFARTAGSTTVYYALIDDVFWLSDQEDLVRQSVSHYGPAESSATLMQDATFASAWPTQVPAGSLVAYLAPRRWDLALQSVDDNSFASTKLMQAWQSVTSVIARVSLNADGPSAELLATLDAEAVSEGWKLWCGSAKQSATLWQSPLPADAILAMGGRMDPVPVVQGLRALMPPGEQLEWDRAMRIARSVFLDQEPWSAIGRTLLNDWGCYLVMRPLTEQTPVRQHPFVAVWTSHFPQDRLSRELRDALENAISFSLNLAMVGLNSQPTGGTTSLQKSRSSDEHHWKFTGRPEGELSVSLRDSRLEISTSVLELDRQAKSPRAALEQTPLSAAATERLQSSAFGIWCHVRELRQQGLVPWVMGTAQARGKSTDHPQVATLVSVAALFDAIDLSAQWSRQRVRLQLGTDVRMAD